MGHFAPIACEDQPVGSGDSGGHAAAWSRYDPPVCSGVGRDHEAGVRKPGAGGSLLDRENPRRRTDEERAPPQFASSERRRDQWKQELLLPRGPCVAGDENSVALDHPRDVGARKRDHAASGQRRWRLPADTSIDAGEKYSGAVALRFGANHREVLDGALRQERSDSELARRQGHDRW